MVPGSLHAGDQPLHALVGHQAGPDDVVPVHSGIPDRVGGPRLHADPDRRCAHEPARDRALSYAKVFLGAGSRARQPASERLVNLAKVFVGFIRGGMALVNILASTMFGCISGSSVADTAAVGSVMIPQMIKNGYPRLFAVN